MSPDPGWQPLQDPPPGARRLYFQGDTVTFTLTVPAAFAGGGWLRTNLGHADRQRREIIRAVEEDVPPLGRDWFDVPMTRMDDRTFRLTLPLVEVGHFAGKCFCLPPGVRTPIWPAGDNTIINVEPAGTGSANIIYNAFVRQFGPNKHRRRLPDPDTTACLQELDREGYAVIPPSGTFRDLIAELDFILGELGCRYLQLLPINPTPTTYARMGRFGSPYAALN
ncbi:MAG: glycogen debranching protein, partial [Deltaproteobacteria bacterium]|nr:glycogen debranching protein [Deltaproteobacteria bacterium]